MGTTFSQRPGRFNLEFRAASLARGTYRWEVVGTVGGNTRTLFQGFVEVLS
jgi:hypothetical protein